MQFRWRKERGGLPSKAKPHSHYEGERERKKVEEVWFNGIDKKIQAQCNTLVLLAFR